MAINGTNNKDFFRGTRFDDEINGAGGDDFFHGSPGQDRLGVNVANLFSPTASSTASTSQPCWKT